MEENQQKNYSSLTPEQKEAYKNQLIESEEILGLQAKIASHKSTIKRSQLEELNAAIRIFELTNPKEPVEEQKTEE